MKQTGREKERKEEDNDYTPVILKRTDEALRHPDDILVKAIEDGIEQLDRGFMSLVLSAMAAGTILGFTAMSATSILTQGDTLLVCAYDSDEKFKQACLEN